MERRICNLENALRRVVAHAEGIEGGQADEVIKIASDALRHLGSYQD
jgi:hypothetical protein